MLLYNGATVDSIVRESLRVSLISFWYILLREECKQQTQTPLEYHCGPQSNGEGLHNLVAATKPAPTKLVGVTKPRDLEVDQLAED